MSLLDKIVDFIQNIDKPRKRDGKEFLSFTFKSRLRFFLKPKEMAYSDNYIQAAKELAPHLQHIREQFNLKEHFS